MFCVSPWFYILKSSSAAFTAKPMCKFRQCVDCSPPNRRIHTDEIIQVHFTVSGFDAGIRWGRLPPVPTGIFHMRPVRGKVLQIGIGTDHSKFPPKLRVNVIIGLKGIFYISVKGAGKWQHSIQIINEALSSTRNVKQNHMVIHLLLI